MANVNLDVIDIHVARDNVTMLFISACHPVLLTLFNHWTSRRMSHFSKAVTALSLAKKDFVASKREFARVVKTPIERAFSISNI